MNIAHILVAYDVMHGHFIPLHWGSDLDALYDMRDRLRALNAYGFRALRIFTLNIHDEISYATVCAAVNRWAAGSSAA